MRASEERVPASLMIAGALVVAAMKSLAVLRWNDWTYGTDTGTFAQAAVNAFHGFTDGPEGGSHFAFHWSPILALLFPLAALTHSPLSLQIAQILLIVCSAVPLYAIVRSYSGTEWGARCGILTLLYPPLISIAFEEFHELAFYPVIALGLVWSADRARWVWFAVLSLLAVTIREDVSVDLVVIGLAFAGVGLFARDERERGLLDGSPIERERLTVAGIAMAFLAAGSLAIYTWIVIPHVGRWAPSHFYDYPFAHGPVQAVLAIFTHPAAVAGAVFTLGRLTYLLEAFAPLAFLPLFTRWTLLALPGFAGVLLASDSIVWRMGFHYSLLWTPWLLLAACWVLCKLHLGNSDDTAGRWWTVAVAICLIVLAAFNPMHPAHYLHREAYVEPENAQRAFACVPKDARLMTHDEWFAHIALQYPKSTNLDEKAAQFSGYVVYSAAWQNAHVQAAIVPALATALRDARFTSVCRYGDVVVLRATSYRTGE